MRRTLLIVAVSLLALGGPAIAETGVNRYAPRGEGPLEPRAPALSTFGDDVIRVRAYPSLGASTWMVELHALPQGRAAGEAVFFERSSLREPWRRSGSVHLRVWEDRWPQTIAQVDALLAEGQSPPSPEKAGEVCVTADGTGYQIERRKAGRDAWMTSESQCGRDPSEAIAQLVFTAAAFELCKAMQGSAPCESNGRSPADALAEYRERSRR